MRVLVIEDDEELAHTIATGLRDASIAVDIALDGQAGLTRALLHDYDVIVLDRDLPILHATASAPNSPPPAAAAAS